MSGPLDVPALADDVLAMDGVAVIGTLGFFIPAAVLLTVVVVAVVRDRRLAAEEAEADAAAEARTHEPLGNYEDIQGGRPAPGSPTPPPAD